VTATPLSFAGRVKRRISWERNRFNLWRDFRRYAAALPSFRRFLDGLPSADGGSFVMISGRGMNVVWAQVWTVLSLCLRVRRLKGLVVASRADRHVNRYFRLLGLELVYLEDLPLEGGALPPAFASRLESAATFEDLKSLEHEGAPVGQIALSTYSRHKGTGVIDLADPEVRGYVKSWAARIVRAMAAARELYRGRDVRSVFFTEVFMEEYGAFYYAALGLGLNVTRFAGTVRDNAFIMQHLNKANDRVHHASLSRATWEKVKSLPFTPAMDRALTQNFLDRYGSKWHRSKRNHPGTAIMDPAEARRALGIAPGRKAAVVYSHILYDTLFFFGTDLFKDYAAWLVETARAACANDRVDWLIKVHPSNLWRGELDTLLKGKYEEERLLTDALGALPPHVRIVSADTKINPYTWFQLADYGVTVRGTSGLEMAALGKTVITAGTGRYEGNGFTVDCATPAEYLDVLKRLPDLPAPTSEQVDLAKRYAYSIFLLKPFTLHSVAPRLRSGAKVFRASDDMVYDPVPFDGKSLPLPADLEAFSRWAADPASLDLLGDWEGTAARREPAVR
jgi:hypothetical protein